MLGWDRGADVVHGFFWRSSYMQCVRKASLLKSQVCTAVGSLRLYKGSKNTVLF